MSLPITFINSAAGVAELIGGLGELNGPAPALYLAVQGDRPVRDGSISILTILHRKGGTDNHVYLIDVQALGIAAFGTPSKDHRTLKAILESRSIPKGTFDVRDDCIGLYAHYSVALQGVEEVRIMEVAARTGGGFLSSLERCIQKCTELSALDKLAWTDARSLDSPSMTFNVRPVLREVSARCVSDVQYLPLLWRIYDAKINDHWRAKTLLRTRDRIELLEWPGYQVDGRDKDNFWD